MSDVRKSSEGIAFEVPMERPTTPGGSPPKRFVEHRNKPISPRDIEEKQQAAEARRKAHLEARLKRIQEVDREHEKLSKAFSSLVEQDAKRQGLPGTENIRPMSRKEASDKIRYIAKNMDKLNCQIQESVTEPN